MDDIAEADRLAALDGGDSTLSVVPANAGTHTTGRRELSKVDHCFHQRAAVWVPAFAGTTKRMAPHYAASGTVQAS